MRDAVLDPTARFYRHLVDLAHTESPREPLPALDRALELIVAAAKAELVYVELRDPDGQAIFQRAFHAGARSATAGGLPFERIEATVSAERAAESQATPNGHSASDRAAIYAPVEVVDDVDVTRRTTVGIVHLQSLTHFTTVDRDCAYALAREVARLIPSLTSKPRLLREVLSRLRRRHVIAALQRHNWNASAVSRELGVRRPNLYNWVPELRQRRRQRRR